MSADQIAHLMGLSGIAHGLGLVSVLLLFLGACGVAAALAGPDRMAFVALVTFGFAAVAVMIAGTVSGWIVPDIMRLMVKDDAANAATWKIAIASIFQINQAMSRVYSVGAAVAITLWSVCCLRMGRLSRSIAIFGCVTSPLVALLVMVGHLRPSVHGFTAVVLSEVIWFAGIGWVMLRADEPIAKGEPVAHGL